MFNKQNYRFYKDIDSYNEKYECALSLVTIVELSKMRAKSSLGASLNSQVQHTCVNIHEIRHLKKFHRKMYKLKKSQIVVKKHQKWNWFSTQLYYKNEPSFNWRISLHATHLSMDSTCCGVVPFVRGLSKKSNNKMVSIKVKINNNLFNNIGINSKSIIQKWF